MYVSTEIINLVISIVSIGLTVLGGGWVLLRSFEKKMDKRFDMVDARFEKVDARFEKVDARFEKVDARFDESAKDINARFDKVDLELHEIRRDIGDVKERIARHEGPRRQLQLR